MRPVQAGEPVRFTLDSGTVVSISKIVSHKRSGDAGRHLHCERLPTSSEVLSGAIVVRQRSDGGVHQERGGGHKIAHFDADDHTAAQVLRQQGDYVGSRLSARSAQHPSGFPVQSRPDSDHGVRRWPWRVYDPCLPSGVSYGSTCLRHSPTDDSSSSHCRIRTPGRSGQMPCPCLGTTGGTFLKAFPSFKMVPQVLQKITQSPGVEVILIAQLQPAASWFPELMDLSQEDPIPLFVEGQDLLTQDVWTGDGVTENRHFRHFMVPRVDGPIPRRSDPAVRRRSRPTDTRRLDGRRGDRESSLPTVKSTRVETLWAILRAKGHSREAANMMSRCLRESSQQVYESHWSRFVAFCRTKRWHVFRFRSHHFSTYMMHLFRDGLLPSTLISYRKSVASVLRHWVYDPAVDPHIKLLVRAFRLERPVQRRIMPKWDLHLVLSLLRPPFISQFEVHGESSDDVIPLKWRTLKCVFLLALASTRRRSYLHALSIAPGRCVFARGNTQRQLVVSLLPEPGFLTKNQLPTRAPNGSRCPGLPTWILRSQRECLSRLTYGTLKESGGPSASVHTLEPQHQGYHEDPHKSMDRGDCQGSLHKSWSSVRPCDGSWGPSAFSFMGVQLSGGPTWHPGSGVLEVFWGVPEFGSARHGLCCWGHVDTGSSGGCTTRSGSRASSPTSIAYTICMQPLLRRS